MSARHELAELVADLRAVLEDARGRGVLTEPEDAPLPEPIRPEGAEPDAEVVAPSPPSERVQAWAQLAARARAEPETPLDRVRRELGDCRRCGLCQARRSIVFGVGDPQADLVVVGEGPGAQEDLKGEPFVGPAGQMLDRMLTNVLGLSRSQVYICNVVKCRPPANRNPLPDEVAACLPFLEAQLEAIRPKLLLVLGSVALRVMVGDHARITRLRGKWTSWKGIPAMPTFHPAYLLRREQHDPTSQDKRHTFADLKAVRARYDELGGRR